MTCMLDQFMQMLVMNRLPNWISFEGENVIGVFGGIGQGAFPQSFGIGGLLPHAMVAFVDGVASAEGGAFEGSNVVAQVHQERGIVRQLLQPVATSFSS